LCAIKEAMMRKADVPERQDEIAVAKPEQGAGATTFQQLKNPSEP
jgi:hypothetical protein